MIYTHQHYDYMETITLKGILSLVFGSLLSYIIEVKAFLIIMIILVACDLYTGIKAAQKRGEVIKSWGLRRTTSKMTLYFIAIMLSKGMEVAFNIPQLVYICALYVCITEFKSNLENISFVTGINIVDQVMAVFKKKE